MIDAERMLGSLVRNAMSRGGKGRRRRRRGRSSMLESASKGALGLGALGVAIAAFEHFSQKQSASSGSFSGSASPQPVAIPPGSIAPPPPPAPPDTASAAELLPPPPPPPPAAEDRGDALLVIRAMIAAANADHDVDDEERARILQALDEAGLGGEERQFLLAELERPIDVATLSDQARTPELSRQVYLASLMAIEVDTPGEVNYLARLAQHLGLDEAQVRELEQMLDGPEG